jgi:hypothetical protein
MSDCKDTGECWCYVCNKDRETPFVPGLSYVASVMISIVNNALASRAHADG